MLNRGVYARIFLNLSTAAAVTLVCSGCSRRASTVSAPPAPPPPPTYAAGTVVAGVPVGGMTQEEAAKSLTDGLKPLGARRVTLVYGAHAYPRSWQDVGVRPDATGMLTSAWKNPAVPLTLTLDVGAAKRSIRRAARALDIAPVEPHFVGAPSKGFIKPGRAGRRVDVYASALQLQSAVAKGDVARTSPLVVVADEPDFGVEDLQPITERLVSYTTYFNPREGNRTHNLRLVAERLNGGLVKPGGVFSFNGWVGERRPSDGFREAIVYKYGKMLKETGGGLCQVSSTLYNVALLTGLPIKQRSHHSLTVHYVPLGRDATVYWGTHDLRFQNDTLTPLYFRTKVGRSALTIEAWGAAPLERRVHVTSTSGWDDGKATARVYRTIAEYGKRTTELVSDDRYETHHEMASVPHPASRT